MALSIKCSITQLEIRELSPEPCANAVGGCLSALTHRTGTICLSACPLSLMGIILPLYSAVCVSLTLLQYVSLSVHKSRVYLASNLSEFSAFKAKMLIP